MVPDHLEPDRSPITRTVIASLRQAVGPLDRHQIARAAVAVLGSALVAYGLREFLRAFGGSYYCCNHAYFATIGLLIAGVGWLGLLGAITPRVDHGD